MHDLIYEPTPIVTASNLRDGTRRQAMRVARGNREKRGSLLCQGYRGNKEVSGKMCGELKGTRCRDVWMAVTGTCARLGGVLVTAGPRCKYGPRDRRFYLLSSTSCVSFASGGVDGGEKK